MRTRSRLTATAALAALLLVGCTDDAPDASPSPTPSSATSAPASPSAPASSPPASTAATVLPGFGDGPASTTATGSGVAQLTAVRIAAQDQFDRVVWQFDGPVPECTARRTAAPIKADPSDQVVAVAGTSFIQLVCQAASGVDLTADPFRDTYTGPDRVDGGDAEVVTEAVLTGDFEAVMSWAVGLETQRPFRLSSLTGPSRVILDVQQ